ncbi:DMT family transporter [Nocardioides sp. WS12]|uniref:DMT family transporter n=1 Tax=Nocardioides sp. WS12 TaxID=2486272 RepID=UPI0015FE0F0B|nr:DMT family transporter [Nocardioides sp. WS12]
MIWLAVVFALASAATTAVSTSTQHLATGKAPSGTGATGLMRFLVRRPEWLLALALGPVGFTFHVLALDNGPIAIVQPIAIMGIVFAVPIRAALARTWPARAELGAVAVTALAIAVLLLASDVRQTASGPDPFTLLVASCACGMAALAALVIAGALTRPVPRAFVLGCASGVLFGLMAVLIEACQLHRDEHGWVGLAATWLPYALVAAGLGGISVNQLAYRSARLSASMPVLNVVNCLLTLGFAHVVFREVPAHTPGSALTSLAALLAMAWGLWRLARLEELAGVPVADDDVLGRRHLGQPHRTARV